MFVSPAGTLGVRGKRGRVDIAGFRAMLAATLAVAHIPATLIAAGRLGIIHLATAPPPPSATPSTPAATAFAAFAIRPTRLIACLEGETVAHPARH